MDKVSLFQVILGVCAILLSTLGVIFTWILNQVSLQLGKLTDSVESLNTKMAVVIEQIQGHDSRITRLEQKGDSQNG